jgi:hypothetical protein
LLAQTTNLSTSKFLRRVTPEVFVLISILVGYNAPVLFKVRANV